ncbi:MAG TPA: hypothetical protein VF933_29080 [Streptosporangiaceae bacterium]
MGRTRAIQPDRFADPVLARPLTVLRPAGHPDPPAACSAAERVQPVPWHLHQVAAERAENLPRRSGQAVMPGQVTGVVVGHPKAERLDRDGSVAEQPLKQLRVVDDRLVQAEGRILVGQGVERVRVGCEDLVEGRAAERLHVLLGEQLEQALLADPAHVVTVVALAVEEHAEVNACVPQDVRQPARQHLEPLVEGREVADEPQVPHRLLAGVLHAEAELTGPPGPHPARFAERVALLGVALEYLLDGRLDLTRVD